MPDAPHRVCVFSIGKRWEFFAVVYLSIFDSMEPYNQTVNFEQKMFYHKDNMRRPSLLLLAPYAFAVNSHLVSCSCTSLDFVCKFLSLTHRYIEFWSVYLTHKHTISFKNSLKYVASSLIFKLSQAQVVWIFVRVSGLVNVFI